MHQRILDGLDDGPVQLRLRAVHLEPDLLAERHRHVAHHARQLVPHHADGLHARLHDAFLQLGGDQVQALRGRVERGVFALGVELQNLVARQHQLAHQIHQLVQQPDADPDVGVDGRGRLGGIFLVPGCFGLKRRRFFRRCSRFVSFSRTGLIFLGCPLQAARELIECLRSLPAGILDLREDAASCIHCFKNQRDQRGVEMKAAIAQQRQQALRPVRNLLENGEAEEPAGALDGVHGAEDTRQQGRIVGTGFELDHIVIEASKVFVAFNKKLLNDLLILLHDAFPARSGMSLPGGGGALSLAVCTFVIGQTGKEFRGE